MIRQLHLPTIVTENVGLAATDLRDLGKVVLLAGPNGAGKSRFLLLLQSIAENLNAMPNQAQQNRNAAIAERAAAEKEADAVAKKRHLESAKAYERQAQHAEAVIEAFDTDGADGTSSRQSRRSNLARA